MPLPVLRTIVLLSLPLVSCGKDAGECTQGLAFARQALAAKDLTIAGQWREHAVKNCKDKAQVDALDIEIAASRAETALSPINPSPPSTVPEQLPLTLEAAQKLTVEARASELKRNCFSSGICDDEAFDVLTKAAASKSEVASLGAIKRSHEQAALSRIRVAYSKLVDVRLQASGFNYDPESNSQVCMPQARAMWAVVDPIAKELEGLALPLPGVSELRSAADYVRNCAAVCLTPADRKIPCNDAKAALSSVAQSLSQAK